MLTHVLMSGFSWPQPYRQLLRYLADRTGILSFANLPLIWLFAGRNNVFIWATGWSFARFNIFHRHVAWIATTQAVIHTLSYFALFLLGKRVGLSSLCWESIGFLQSVDCQQTIQIISLGKCQSHIYFGALRLVCL